MYANGNVNLRNTYLKPQKGWIHLLWLMKSILCALIYLIFSILLSQRTMGD